MNILVYLKKIDFFRFWALRKELRKDHQDVVLAFLKTPSIIAEIASMPIANWGLIVSERNAYIDGSEKYLVWRRFFHMFADFVVVNSYTNQKLIERNSPWLMKK